MKNENLVHTTWRKKEDAKILNLQKLHALCDTKNEK